LVLSVLTLSGEKRSQSWPARIARFQSLSLQPELGVVELHVARVAKSEEVALDVTRDLHRAEGLPGRARRVPARSEARVLD
jgi:hypothetical protein